MQPEPADARGGTPQRPLPFKLLATCPTEWDPAATRVTMNLRLDGCIVPSQAEGARVSYSHVVVLDDFVDFATRRELLAFLTGSCDAVPAGGSSAGDVPSEESAGAPAPGAVRAAGSRCAPGRPPWQLLPPHLWERRTADMAGSEPSWGLRPHLLEALASGRVGAAVQVQSRLCKLYPECDIAHMPSAAIQGGPRARPEGGRCSDDAQLAQQDGGARVGAPAAKRPRGGDGDGDGGDAAGQAPLADCSAFLANAAVAADSFVYHLDADPASFPPGPWVDAYGDYFNGEPGRPLLASLLLYLDDEWPRDWAADTLFLDAATDTGVFVRPRPGRAVLMDQDVMHRVSPPSAAAGGRPRFSLVWKLCFLPRAPARACCLARPEWGAPVSFGSAARVEAVKRSLAAEARPPAAQHAEQALS